MRSTQHNTYRRTGFLSHRNLGSFRLRVTMGAVQAIVPEIAGARRST